MKSIVKKVAIFSMIGIMQVAFSASVMEASPLHNDPSPMQERFDRHDQRQDWHERERFERERRERMENQRHEREMKRRPHESRREWRERQQHENQRHERELRMIRDHGRR